MTLLALILALLAIVLPVLPVALASWVLGPHLLGLPQLAFALLVLVGRPA
jgi:hypothetical protein